MNRCASIAGRASSGWRDIKVIAVTWKQPTLPRALIVTVIHSRFVAGGLVTARSDAPSLSSIADQPFL